MLPPVTSIAACASSVSTAATALTDEEQQQDGAGVECEGELAERAGVGGMLDMPPGEGVPGVHIPEMKGRVAGRHQPVKLLLIGQLALEGAQRLPQNRQSGRIALGVVRCQAVQQQIGCARRV
ncbi:hypothetical protein ABIA33_006971 [Streptacidiphilus sp. MAP12-16]|uniref:hypothetical protein n=1 Tax=Streptacidiphilus sp. MAP12-16 TaxID=3156300 RepID=UPI0035116315